jgi:hypothetical protein
MGKEDYKKALKKKKKNKVKNKVRNFKAGSHMSTSKDGKLIKTRTGVTKSKSGKQGTTKQVSVKNPITGKVAYVRAVSYSEGEGDKGKRDVITITKKGAKKKSRATTKGRVKYKIKKAEKKVRKALAKEYN